MRVAIDTNPLYVTQAGVARYVRGLLMGFQQIADPRLDHWELAWPVYNFEYKQPRRAFKTAYRELFWARICAPRLLIRGHAEIFHTTGPLVITPPPAITHVVTLHDLAVLRYPERFRPWFRRAAAKDLKKLHNAHRVIAISRFTADEAAKLLGLNVGKVEVVYNGCDEKFFQAEKFEEMPSESVESEFFLFVGSLEPGKNLALLREAYVLAETRGILLPPLLIVGARWRGVKGEGPPPQSWRYLGRVPDEQLMYLYRRAIALLFPSKYEGFGLPVVEAMAAGCPVICSRNSSLPEVAGGAALFCEQTADAYLKSMLCILETPALRETLIADGKQQALRFNWRKCAAETLAVYLEARH